jgi:hypothetical protein
MIVLLTPPLACSVTQTSAPPPPMIRHDLTVTLPLPPVQVGVLRHKLGEEQDDLTLLQGRYAAEGGDQVR